MITRRGLHEDRPRVLGGYENLKDPGDNLANLNALFMIRHSFGPLHSGLSRGSPELPRPRKIWVFLGKRNLNPNTPVKFAIGLIFMALGFIIMLFAVEYALVSSPVGVQWLLLTYLLHTFGELALSPVGLSAFSKYSPKRYLGQMMGLWFLASSLGGVLAGLFGGEATSTGLDSMTPIFSELVYYYLVLAVVLIVLSFFIKGKVEE